MEENQADTYVSWVTPQNFDPDKITLQTSSSGNGDINERGKIMYEYSPGAQKKNLVITVPRTPDAYMTCRGVHKQSFSRGDQRIETNRYETNFVLTGDNNYHVALYDTFKTIMNKVEQLTGATVVFPVHDMDTYSILYAGLIHANNGPMYSSAYTEDEQLDILHVKKSIVRPALMLSTLKRSDGQIKIQVQVQQMFVYKEEDEVVKYSLAFKD